MGLLSDVKNFFCEMLGIETKKEKEERLKKEQNSPDPKEEQKAATQEEKEKKEREWKDLNEKDKFVCHGGKIQCTFCNPPIADIIVTSNTIMLQDKPFATIKDKDGKKNFNFTGLCMHPSQQKPGAPPPPCKSVISLGEWKNFSDTMIGNDNALLVKSTIPCMISGQDLEIIHSGQMAELAEVKPKVKRNPQIIESYWINEDGEKIEKIAPNKYASLIVKTKDYKRTDEIRVTLPVNDQEKEFVTRVNSQGIAVFNKVFHYITEEFKEPLITKMYWIDSDTEKIVKKLNPNQKVRLCFETENFKKGEKVKACIKFKNGKKFANDSTQLIFSGIVDENGFAISEEVCENS